ncbi:MAG TPA: CPBP family glutamic-type intramembrane protease [Fimbriiglobus sp.]|nr:CPBP family glutamic-type intramembrane protease [Fimbriiglobus sp.]
MALAVVVGNLEHVRVFRRRRWLVIPIGAALFGAAHAFDMRLVVATFLLELVVIPLYLWRRNLWAYGVLHGWIGALFWLWVLGRDQWVENFGH